MTFEELVEHLGDLADLAQSEGYENFAAFLRFAWRTAASLPGIADRVGDPPIAPTIDADGRK